MEDTTPDYGKCPCTGQYQNRTIEVRMTVNLVLVEPARRAVANSGFARPPSRTGPEAARAMRTPRSVEVAPVPGRSQP